MIDDTSLRDTFNQVAGTYHAVRPSYPEALFDVLVQRVGLSQSAKLLEIGPGTGKATEPLAHRGYDITAIELGEELAVAARMRLKEFRNVRVITEAFEEAELPSSAFDLVYAATAFHWINAEKRYSKSHRLLKPGGHLAIIHTNHVSDDQGDCFFRASQSIYKRYESPETYVDGHMLPKTEELHPPEIDDGLFELVDFELFPQVVRYSAETYAKLIGTFSPTLVMVEDERIAFLGELQQMIEQDFGGAINKHFAMSLAIAGKRG